MGQRLNIEITNGEQTYCNAYYHWGAYTTSALAYTKDIIEYCKSHPIPTNCEDVLQKRHKYAISILESTGAALTREELELYNSLFDENKKINPLINRNEGLIAISSEGMRETRKWSEGDVIIDIVNQTINFQVFYDETNEESLKDPSIPILDCSSLTFDNFNGFLSKFSELRKKSDCFRSGDVVYGEII